MVKLTKQNKKKRRRKNKSMGRDEQTNRNK
jgi:hypothetical protein